jgi:hypothetical protein
MRDSTPGGRRGDMIKAKKLKLARETIVTKASISH